MSKRTKVSREEAMEIALHGVQSCGYALGVILANPATDFKNIPGTIAQIEKEIAALESTPETTGEYFAEAAFLGAVVIALKAQAGRFHAH